jgi:hypothetical protein
LGNSGLKVIDLRNFPADDHSGALLIKRQVPS